jgi:hypothetical protein
MLIGGVIYCLELLYRKFRKESVNMGCLFGLLDWILIKSWIWLIVMFFNTLKYMVWAVVSVFVGPAEIIKRHAKSNTSRKTGIHPDEVERVVPDLYKVERFKVTAWLVWAYLYWAFVIGAVIYGKYFYV